MATGKGGVKSSRQEEAGVAPTCFQGPRLVPDGLGKAASNH
jgi:hypothetical protein